MAEPSLDRIPLGDADRQVGGTGGVVLGQHAELDHVAPTLLPRVPVAVSDREPIEPSLPRTGIAEGGDVTPG